MSDELVITNVDEVYVHVKCEDGIAYELREYFTFEVPGFRFTPAYKNRLWDGKIRLFDLRSHRIYRGLANEIMSFCRQRGYKYEYEDLTEEFSLVEASAFIKSLKLPIEPRDYQISAFAHAIRNKRSLLVSPTASGKSLIIYLILRYLHDNKITNKSLVVVPTTSLVSQLAGDFASYGFDSVSNIHTITAGKDKSSDMPITISTWQSLYKMDKSYFRMYDTVIGDECHLFKANSLKDIMTGLTRAHHRIGTTGTLDGTKTHKLVLEGLFGPVNKVTTTKDLMDQKHVADFRIKCLVLKHPPEKCKALRKATYQEELNYIVMSDARNRFIKNLALSLEGNTLILYQFVDKHGQILLNSFKNEFEKRKVFFVHGGVSGDDREEIRRIVEKETDAIIVASYGTFSTGINIKQLNNIIFASPSKSRIRNLQSIGRGLRVSDTKTEAVLFDISDDLRTGKKENYTLKHFMERLRIYSDEKFRFKIYQIQLKG